MLFFKDDTLLELAKNNTNIAELYLQNSSEITNVGMKSVLTNCVKLRVIHLDFLTKVDKEIMSCFEGFQLRELREIQAKTNYHSHTKTRWGNNFSHNYLTVYCPKLYYFSTVP